MHVGKFYPPHMGGMELHLQTLCCELAKSVDVSVVVAADGPTGVAEIHGSIPVRRIGTMCKVAGASICPGMTQAIRTSNADIVHMHHPNPTAALSYIASGHRGRLIVTWHLDIVRQRFLGAMFAPFQRILLRKARAVIATSQNYVDSSPWLASCRDRCYVVPYGIHTDAFACADRNAVAEIRRRFGSRIVLAIGRLVYYKGFEYLVRAMSKVDAKLLLIGDGPWRHRLEREASNITASDRVIFLSEMSNSELAPYYHAADVFVLPSVARSEAFGIVQIEAMSAGVPVINTNLESGVPSVSLHGQTGLTVAPRDEAALGDALNELLANGALRQRMSEAARIRARDAFGVEKMSSRTVRIYDRVMEMTSA
jgi:rhamnosyl/mannosyltransferase